MKYGKKIMAWLVVFLMMLSLGVTTVFAVEPLDPEQTCQLDIEFHYDGKPVAGAEFWVYRIGEFSEDGTMTLTGDFAGYPVEINGLSDTELQKAVKTLYDYAQMDGLTPDHGVITDENGFASLTDLAQGLYLLAGRTLKQDGWMYLMEPQLVTLPGKLTVESEWDYHVTVQPKCSVVPEEVEPLTLKVLKKWDDNGNEDLRPAYITVHLLKDGEVYDTVTLTEEIEWRYTWTDLDPNCEWTVVEEVPTGYTVVVTQEGITFLVTNTYDEPPPPDDPPPPDIPQTGLLWWPVPVLALLGIVLIAVGYFSRKGGRHEA